MADPPRRIENLLAIGRRMFISLNAVIPDSGVSRFEVKAWRVKLVKTETKSKPMDWKL
jgi:hypothetical protein